MSRNHKKKTIMNIFLRIFSLLLMSLLLILVACEKESADDDQQTTLNDQMLGTWQFTNENYAGLTEYRSNGNGTDVFIHKKQIDMGENTEYIQLTGTAEFKWNFENDELHIEYISLSDYYQEYNELSVGTNITVPIDINDNSLSMNYQGEIITYTKIPGNSVMADDLKKSWQITDGDYTGFFTIEDIRFWDSFIDGNQNGMGSGLCLHVGNAIIIGYEELYGNYEIYNQIPQSTIMILPISISDNNLAFKYGEEEYVYSLFDEMIDISGSWQHVDGNYSGILTFDGLWGFNEAFTDEENIGSSQGFCFLNGNILTMQYRELYADFETYNDIQYNTTYTMFISRGENQLLFNLNSNSYEYTFFDNSINPDDLQGSWEIELGDYSGVMTFDGNMGTDTFSDVTQSGSANFSWFISGNIITLTFNSLEGDYESYNGISHAESIISPISLNNNELIFHFADDDYTYTFISE